jgi:hypothetical protein
MDPVLQPASDKLDNQSLAITGLQLQIQKLQNQPSVTSYIVTDVQLNEQPGNVGNSGGGSTKPHGTYAISRDPQKLSVVPVGQYDNFYFLKRLSTVIPASKLSSASQFSHVGTYLISNLNACQALEGDMQLQIGAKIWNIGWQLLPGTLWKLRIWNRSGMTWVDTGITVDPALLLEAITIEIDATFDNKSVSYKSAIINGVYIHPLTQSYPIISKVGSDPNHVEYNIANQLDCNSIATQYNVIVTNLTASIV